MLLDAHRGRAVGLLHELGLDAPVLDEPHCDAVPRCVSAIALPEADASASTIVASLAAWAVDRQAASLDVISRWRRALVLSNDERDGLRAVLRDLPRLRGEWEALAVAGRKRLAAGPWFAPSLRVLAAVDPAVHRAIERDVQVLRDHAGGLTPEPLVTGDDLVAAGHMPGPRFKAVLEAVYDEQLEGRLTGREEGLALAGRMLGR